MKKSEHSAVWKKGKIYKLKHSVIQKKRHEFKRRKNQMIQPQGKKLNNMTKKIRRFSGPGKKSKE